MLKYIYNFLSGFELSKELVRVVRPTRAELERDGFESCIKHASFIHVINKGVGTPHHMHASYSNLFLTSFI